MTFFLILGIDREGGSGGEVGGSGFYHSKGVVEK
jgi:hypothetical protein